MSSVTLTIRDLIEICQFMGQPEGCIDHWLEYMEEGGYEESLTIHHSYKGIAVLDEVTGKEERYQLTVTCDGCDSNEVQPIGDPL